MDNRFFLQNTAWLTCFKKIKGGGRFGSKGTVLKLRKLALALKTQARTIKKFKEMETK